MNNEKDNITKAKQMLKRAKHILAAILNNKSETDINEYARKNANELFKLLSQFKELTGKNLNIDTQKVITNHEYMKNIASAICEYLDKYTSVDSDKYMEITNALIYHKLIDALSSKGFNKEDSEQINKIWPQKLLCDSNGLSHIAQIMPDPGLTSVLNSEELQIWKTKIAGYLMLMNDETADVMDILTSNWLENALSVESTCVMHADEILKARGIKPRKNNVGRISTYKLEDRQKIANHIHILSNTWLTSFEFDIPNDFIGKRKRNKHLKLIAQSPVIQIDLKFGIQNAPDGNIDEFIWRIKPGSVLADYLLCYGRTTLLQSQKALSYNPYKQKEEKRLTRYLAWDWGTSYKNTTRSYKVFKLLDIVHKKIDTYHPSNTQVRLEQALDRLAEDCVIKGWQYENNDEINTDSIKWLEKWLENSIIIEAPDAYTIKSQEIKTKNKTIKEDTPSDELNQQDKLCIEFASLRKQKNITTREMAKILNISHTTVVRIEKGLISKKLQHKVESWLNNEKGSKVNK